MSYRFSNIGEKSNNRLFYEWLCKNPLGFQFTIEDMPPDFPIERKKISAICAFFEKSGTIETIGRKQYLRKGKSGSLLVYDTRVYKFLRRHDGRFNSKPLPTERKPRARKTGKHNYEVKTLPLIGESLPKATDKKVLDRAKNMIEFLLNTAAIVEELVKENERLRKAVNEKV